MKSLIAILSLALAVFTLGCSKETKDDFSEAGEKIEDAAKTTGDAIKSGAEDAAKTLKENEAAPPATDTQSPTHSN